MNTLMLKVDPDKPDAAKIRVAAEIIQRGGLVAFPTETVYGLGADGLNGDAVLRLFEAKKRPLDNPPILHVAEVKDVYPLVTEVSQKAEQLMKQFWPGPLTLVFKHSANVPKESTGGFRHRRGTHAKAPCRGSADSAKQTSHRGAQREPLRQTQPHHSATRIRGPQRTHRRHNRRRSSRHRSRIHSSRFKL
jgi:hypothetical protein